MARTPLSTDLIHRADDVARDGQALEALCRHAERVAAPVVRAALLRETADEAAAAWIEQAAAALGPLLVDPDELASVDAAVRADLGARLRAALPPPDESLVADHTRDTVAVLVRAWLAALEASLGDADRVEVPGLLGAHTAAPPWLAPVALAVEPFALSADDAATVLAALCAEALADPHPVALPRGLALRANTTAGARTAWLSREHAAGTDASREVASREVAWSGEQLRDGVAAPPEAPRVRKPPGGRG